MNVTFNEIPLIDLVYVPDLEPAPRYAELNPGGTTDIVHVITTLEEPTR